MSEKIIINPITRISGFMEIEVTVENRRIVDAKTKGQMFRGFEMMLNGRAPLDAIYYTERICGICSTAHSLAATLALEQAFGVGPTAQGRYVRDFMHGCEFLQNHIRHFYQFTVPDFVKMPENYPLYQTNFRDFRLPKEANDLLVQHYFDSLPFSRAAHQLLALFGGKAPHNHGIFMGGTTARISADSIVRCRSILQGIGDFIENVMIPDVGTLARYYPDYYENGAGYGNLLSFGCFDGYPELGTLYIDPSVSVNAAAGGTVRGLDPGRITEEIDYSWYIDSVDTYTPFETIPMDDQNKEGAYSFIKASKLENLSFEVGPLARQWLSGEYRRGISTMDRYIARVLEAKKIHEILLTLLDQMIPGPTGQAVYITPDSARGQGLTDTTRGALGHWIKIENSVLDFYQIITPSVWNLSSHGNDGSPGTSERALIGTELADEDRPAEIGRIIRSFDPCVSCATHVFYPNKEPKFITVVP
ncbi:MAG: nickel-dependent hydrogenase large subunit [Bacillota bacterium]|jgi:hydrogenase large subunit|nr:nickel-dependent hydrogenase large subunit [Bacillota bacterium]